jgi:peroxiredoxin
MLKAFTQVRRSFLAFIVVLLGIFAAATATIDARIVLLLGTLAAGTAAVDAQDKAPTVGTEAKDFELTALGGEKVRLTALTGTGPVVVVVLRGYPGYQCPLCTAQYSDFLKQSDKFKKAGSQVVFVYPGPAEKLKERAGDFARGKDYPEHFHFLLDPDYAMTTAYGLRWNAKGETAYPSTFVIDGTCRIQFAIVSTSHSGRAKAADVLKSLNTN